MKNVKLLSVFVVCFLVLTASVNATGFRSEFKDYEIEAVDDLNFGKKVEKVWTLTYNSSEKPVTVLKHKTLDGVEYMVRNDFFEVCYAITSNGFGAKKVKNSWSNVPRQINRVVLNKEQLKRQEVISPKKEMEDEKALGLIANFLPDLINDEYTHLLN